MPLPDLIWDTCTMLNLVASGQIENVLPCLSAHNYIVREVREKEALFLRPLPEEDPHGNLVPFDLLPILDSGLLIDVELTPVEEETFVKFALQVDDGEAKTAAVAVHRGYQVATDDRRALRLLASLLPPVSTLTTLEWLELWANQTRLTDHELGLIMRNIRCKANFLPRRSDPLYSWWLKNYP